VTNKPENAGLLTTALKEEFKELISHYPEQRAALIPALHRCQEDLGGWLSPEILEELAELFSMEPVEVFGVASFYPMFHLKPVGEHVIGVCHNISCALRGAEDLLHEVCEATGCEKPGATSPDGKYTVLRLECQGTCVNAPMFDLDGVYHENIGDGDVQRILGGLK